MPLFNKIYEFSSDSNDLSQYFPPNSSVHKHLPAHWVPWPLLVKNHRNLSSCLLPPLLVFASSMPAYFLVTKSLVHRRFSNSRRSPSTKKSRKNGRKLTCFAGNTNDDKCHTDVYVKDVNDPYINEITYILLCNFQSLHRLPCPASFLTLSAI